MSTYIDRKEMKDSHELDYDITFKKVLSDGVTIVYYNSKGQVVSTPPIPWT